MRYLILLLPTLLCISCVSPQSSPDTQPTAPPPRTGEPASSEHDHRATINEHVSTLAQALVNQPVMTPRPGFSGYLAHMGVIRTTTQDSPFAVIADGEGFVAADTPIDFQDFANLKGKHPYGGTYAFSGTDKDRGDDSTRIVLEIPGPAGDGLMAIGFTSGEVITIDAPTEALSDAEIQSILSIHGGAYP